jgi:hypothetical protein
MKKEHPCSELYPSTAAAYTIIGIGERHTGQACVLGSLVGKNVFCDARRITMDHCNVLRGERSPAAARIVPSLSAYLFLRQ